MAYTFSFEKLNVWVDAKQLGFIKENDYQILRAKLKKFLIN